MDTKGGWRNWQSASDEGVAQKEKELRFSQKMAVHFWNEDDDEEMSLPKPNYACDTKIEIVRQPKGSGK